MKKKELLCILAITALSTVFVGCTTNDNSNQQMQNNEEMAIVQETVQTEEVVSENDVPQEEEASFDGIIVKEGEEVAVKPGDVLMVEGDSDFVIGIVECSHISERDVYRAELTYADGDFSGENLVYFSTTDEDRELWGEEDYMLIFADSSNYYIVISSYIFS